MATLADALSMPAAFSARSSSAGSSSAGSLSANIARPSSAAEGLGAKASTTGAYSSAGAARNLPIFEFTKRKRWADLLVTELSEAIILALSPGGKVWYCGSAVFELLGWKDEDVVDREFSEYINQDDRSLFQASFLQCIHYRSELLTYTRLRCKPALPNLALSVAPQDFQASANMPVKEVLFEIKGYPHFVSDPTVANGSGVASECKCFFMMAKPYPSRNTAMLNTFLELKMENQRLEDRLVYLRTQADAVSLSPPSGTTSSTFPPAPYPTSSAYPTTNPYGQSQTQYASIPTLPEPTSFYSGTFEELLPSPSNVRFESVFPGASGAGTAGQQKSSMSSGSGEDDEASAKKKLKKSYGFEQYVCVTCGRTDSPEWRKGPNGPKTLCNACGLRWAKTVKTRKDGASTT